MALRNANANVALFTIQRPCALHAERQSKVGGIQGRFHHSHTCSDGEKYRRRATAAAATGTAQEAEEKRGVEKCVGAIHIHFAYAAG